MALHHATTQVGGEAALICAVIQQAHKDLRSLRGEVREEARLFWLDEERVGFFADLLDLDPEAPTRAVQP